MKVLVCDPIHRECVEKLEEAGFVVDVNPTISHEELREVVSEYDTLFAREASPRKSSLRKGDHLIS